MGLDSSREFEKVTIVLLILLPSIQNKCGISPVKGSSVKKKKNDWVQHIHNLVVSFQIAKIQEIIGNVNCVISETTKLERFNSTMWSLIPPNQSEVLKCAAKETEWNKNKKNKKIKKMGKIRKAAHYLSISISDWTGFQSKIKLRTPVKFVTAR